MTDERGIELRKYYVYVLKRPDKLDEYGEPLIFYVGKGAGNRSNVHTRDSEVRNNRTYKSRMIKMLFANKQHPIIEIVFDKLTEPEAFEKEIELIAKYGRKDNNTGILCNLTDGGEGSSGCSRPRSAETRRKYSEAMKGHKVSEETRQKIREARKKQAPTMLGKHLSEDTKEKIRQANLGKKQSDETKKKMSIAHKGRRTSEETKEKLRQINIGRKHTPEALQKIIKANRNRKTSHMLGKHLSHETKIKISEARQKLYQDKIRKRLEEERVLQYVLPL
ncbi:MAG: NUMOD3 domain-containing DNA-binding protein [Patescibacteria group bacterium]|nr:NUMOD3 domain-containing DNA-binding protein [Patescibacteria group bacterium]